MGCYSLLQGIILTQGLNSHFLSCFTDVKTLQQIEDINYLVTMSTQPPDLLQPVCVCVSRFSHVQLFATLWTVAHQGPLPMEFSRQEYWSGLPCPPPGDLPDPGIKP